MSRRFLRWMITAVFLITLSVSVLWFSPLKSTVLEKGLSFLLKRTVGLNISVEHVQLEKPSTILLDRIHLSRNNKRLADIKKGHLQVKSFNLLGERTTLEGVLREVQVSQENLQFFQFVFSALHLPADSLIVDRLSFQIRQRHQEIEIQILKADNAQMQVHGRLIFVHGKIRSFDLKCHLGHLLWSRIPESLRDSYLWIDSNGWKSFLVVYDGREITVQGKVPFLKMTWQ